MENPYRHLPSVDRLLGEEQVRELRAVYGHDAVVGLVREVLDNAREEIARGRAGPSLAELVEEISARAAAALRPTLRPVINATGVILHTNLGRAPLSDEAIAAMNVAAAGYSNLEFDLEAGERGSRHRHGEQLLCQLTGAEAALVVNNNASAVLLALTALASGHEVLISRGQAVEIGGGFRIPDVMRQSGAVLVDVGTTNRTYLSDYAQAISPHTALILRVHTSNFKVVGFVHDVPLSELVSLASEAGIAVLDDLGSGCLIDTRQFGLAAEPLVQDSVRSGAGLTCFSGDKLLGGPQAGLIVGQKRLVDKLKRHPLARATRIDKVTLAGLLATLLHYLRGEAIARVPIWRMIATPTAELSERAQRWSAALGERAAVVDGRSAIGGGSLPEETLPSKLVAISAGEHLDQLENAGELARRLRLGEPAVVARVERDLLLLDPRTVLPGQDEALLRAVKAAIRSTV